MQFKKQTTQIINTHKAEDEITTYDIYEAFYITCILIISFEENINPKQNTAELTQSFMTSIQLIRTYI